MEGWKKARRADNSLISTRARSAALKADSQHPPLNLWFIAVIIITAACLLASAYIVYSALNVPPPEPITSIQTFLDLGNYQQVIDILEGKELSEPLSNNERNKLSLAYLNMAKQNITENKIEAALSYLYKIDPKTPSAAEASILKTKLVQK